MSLIKKSAETANAGCAGPLLTARVAEYLAAARYAGVAQIACSLDLERSKASVTIYPDSWVADGKSYPYVADCKARTVYYWADTEFQAVARYGASLIKLVPTDWGPPTFEIDGIKMLPTAKVSPYLDAQTKVALVRPRGKVVLDCCGGLGYFAAWCVSEKAAQILSFEKNADVIWLRDLNPWSPRSVAPLTFAHADVTEAILEIPDASIDSVLHDPPRFGIAGELYSAKFYLQLARVLKRRGRLFHYTGSPNKHSSGRNLAYEVGTRLGNAGFAVEQALDGVIAVKV